MTVGVLLGVLGFAAAVQIQANGRDDAYRGTRQEDLVQLLNSLAAASQRADTQLADLEETRARLQDSTEQRRTAFEQAQQQEAVLSILAGTVPTVGPGVAVTVKDPDGNVGTNELLNGLEELRDAGAEAVELNNRVRVVASTAFRDAGTGVNVDGAQLQAPYTIEAIGAPETLAEGLDFTDGFTDNVEEVGGSVTVTQLDTVAIDSTHEPARLDFAVPVPPS